MKYSILPILLLHLLHSGIGAQKPIEGTWKLVAKQWDTPTKMYADAEVYKIITGSHWISVGLDPSNHELYWTIGGTYAYSKGVYTEKITYFSLDSASVGNINVFEMTVDDDMLEQQTKGSSPSKGDHFILEYYQRLEPALSTVVDIHPLAGVWRIVEAQYGDAPAMENAQESSRALKIITPAYFAAVFADSDSGKFGGISFGKQKVTGQNYTEDVHCFTWDQGLKGKEQKFQWALEDGEFIQSGRLSSSTEKYDDYLIEERYERLE